MEDDQMENDWHKHTASFLGKQVRVKLDEQVIVEGKFLAFGDGGDFEIEAPDLFVHHCWPLLHIEEVK